MEEEHQPLPAHLEVLEASFGHPTFRPKQWNIIRSIIEEEQDNIVVMPTGYGKSLIYQYPSVLKGGTTIVISPFISLMQDQVNSLDANNIRACYLGSAQPNDRTPDIMAGEYRIVYLTPEYVARGNGRTLLMEFSRPLDLIAIDEAYWMSVWGFGFREDYLEICEILRHEKFSNVPILAVTAAATQGDLDDIKAQLDIQNAQTWRIGLDRPNLDYLVRTKGEDMWNDVANLLTENRESSIIIYCLTHEQTNMMSKLLKSNQINCEAYHAGIEIERRTQIQESFMRNEVKIIVATVAFLINKPDIRLVIHYGVAMELGTYHVQVGQAGRDEEQSNCVMFWDEADFVLHNSIRRNRNLRIPVPTEEERVMRNYLNSPLNSWRNFILQYYEGLN